MHLIVSSLIVRQKCANYCHVLILVDNVLVLGRESWLLLAG